MSSASPKRPIPPGKSLLETYLGHFPILGTRVTKEDIAAHFEQVAKSLWEKASECLAASDLLRKGVDLVPVPVRKISLTRNELNSGTVIPCEMSVDEVLGVVPPAHQAICFTSATIDLHRYWGNGFTLCLGDWTTKKTISIRLIPGSLAEGKAMANFFAMMAKTLEADGEHAEYCRKVPSDRLCKHCKKATVRPGMVPPGSPAAAHRDHYYCMTCKAYLDATK
jgi:hypothetical protein